MTQAETKPSGDHSGEIMVLKIIVAGEDDIYHFFIDGIELGITLRREDFNSNPHESTYYFRNGEKEHEEFGEADVLASNGNVSLEWVGLREDDKERGDEEIRQNRRLISSSLALLKAGMRADYPDAKNIYDEVSNPF